MPLVHVDSKGKIFTNVITKKPVRALIHMAAQTLVGSIYLRPDNRLLDELNDSQAEFLAVTDVYVYDETVTTLLYTTRFLAVNKAHVLAIVPFDELDAGAGMGVWLSSLRAAARAAGTSQGGEQP